MHWRTRTFRNCMLLLLAAGGFNWLVYSSGRALTRQMEHHMLATAIDGWIPFLPWTIVVYWGCFLFWVVNYYIGIRYDNGNRYRFIGAHFIGEILCFFIFCFFPTTMVRGEVEGNSVAEWIVMLTYHLDSADNLFPSIHCFVSWLCWIAVRNHPMIPEWYKKTSLLLAIAVCISTLTVKQHVIADVPAGILLAEFSYILSRFITKYIAKYTAEKESMHTETRFHV